MQIEFTLLTDTDKVQWQISYLAGIIDHFFLPHSLCACEKWDTAKRDRYCLLHRIELHIYLNWKQAKFVSE